MTATDQAIQTAPAPTAARPFRIVMLIPTLVIGVVLPIAIFKILEKLGVAPVWALAAGCVPAVFNNLRVWIASRRLDPVSLLITASIGTGVAASFISGDIASRIVTDCVISSAWGLVFLGSLLLSRPLIFFMIGSVVAGDDASRNEAWSGLWRYAAFRSAMRWITAACGGVYFVQMLVELGLYRVLRADTVVTIAPLIGTGGTVLLLVLIRPAMQATRRRLERDEHLTWPL
jgi:hypothetical protein